MLVLLNTPESTKLGFGEVELSNEAFEINISKFDITFHVMQSAHGLPVSIVYNTGLFREDTINRMAGHFKQLLTAVVKDPQQNIDALQMLTEAEEQQLLVEFN
jgi:non-ribosomal peptide synthetase component F